MFRRGAEKKNVSFSRLNGALCVRGKKVAFTKRFALVSLFAAFFPSSSSVCKIHACEWFDTWVKEA